MLTSTQKLDHCWICKVKFNQDLVSNEHHVIPRAYGGEDGPQVSLCAGHHDRMHFIALRLISNKPYHDLLTTDLKANERMLYLAGIIQRAEALFSKDPNKKVLTAFSSTQEWNTKLRRLSKVHKLAKTDYLIKLVENEHKRIFGS